MPLCIALSHLLQQYFLDVAKNYFSPFVFFSTATAVPHLELPAVVGIAFSAFIIGISLTGGLWFIHSQTGGCEAAHNATGNHFFHINNPAHIYLNIVNML